MKKRKQGWRSWAVVVIGRYWLFQGMRYMNWIERLHRLGLEFVFGIFAWFAAGFFLKGWAQFAVAAVIAHSSNMVLNGHLFALFKHDLYWFGFYKSWPDFRAYVEQIRLNLVKKACPALCRAEIYGGLTQGRFNESSDLDLRLIAKPGFLQGLTVAHIAFVERLRALRAGFPLDVYMFRSEIELSKKMDLAVEKAWVIYPVPTQTPSVFSGTQIGPEASAQG